MKEKKRLIYSAKEIKVIEVKKKRGTGKEEDPVRMIIQYWDLKGHLLAEKDEWLENKRSSI